MFRNITGAIEEYYGSGAEAPLLVLGPRGVGKTYSALEYAKRSYRNYLYLNFETDKAAVDYFTAAEQAEKSSIIDTIINYFEIDNSIANQIFYIFDEIEACESFCRMINSTKDFNLHILCLSSFIIPQLTVNMHILNMRRMSFLEFLKGIDKNWYVDIIEGHFEKKKPLPKLVYDEIIDLFYDYISIGGMPKVITAYVADDTDNNLFELHRECNALILFDILKYGDAEYYSKDYGLGTSEPKKMREILNVLSAEPNVKKRKFVFNRIRRGVTGTMYAKAIELLIFNGIIYSSNKLEAEDFRLTLFDHGILNCLIRSENTIEEDKLETILIYNYITEQLSSKYKTSYWESEYSAHVDWVCELDDMLVSMDFSQTGSANSKSAKLFLEIYKSAEHINISCNNYGYTANESLLPIYNLELL